MLYVLMYLFAIVIANIAVATYGPSVTILNAFLLIGLDLTARDRLHEAWHGRSLWPKMALLIAAGSLLSWLLNRDAGSIALASFVAFATAGAVDAVSYQWLYRRGWLVKVNGSNMLAAGVDSVLFPTLAFGALLPWIVLGQFVAKVAGGAVWSVILRGWRVPAKEDATDAIST